MTLELTQEQLDEIDGALEGYTTVSDSALQIIANKVIEIIERSEKYQFSLAPCPEPVLTPVVVQEPKIVTVESLYGSLPKLPVGWQAVLGPINKMKEQGFTHFCMVPNGRIELLDNINTDAVRICLKKWEGN